MSINDIHTLLEPLRERFQTEDKDAFSLSDIYTEISELEGSLLDPAKEDIRSKMEKAERSFADVPREYRDRMRMFAFISMLAYDVYIKKLLIEKMIDGLKEPEKAEAGKKHAEKHTERRKKG